ncbi:MAG: hypothetical protein ABIJ57_08665 [Pseudomonadota bacterium]
MKILTLNGIQGYGYPESCMERELEPAPDVIGADAGSTDQGPYSGGVSFIQESREVRPR